MNLIYGVKDRPKTSEIIIYAFQQVLAILSATITVPMIINAQMGVNMSMGAAILGAGLGTITYLLFTKLCSPVFLSSSFAFIGSMCVAFAGASSMAMGYAGLIIGAAIAGGVYVLLALIIKRFGVGWVSKLMPPIIIGPTVTIVGLSLASSAITNVTANNSYVGLICGIITFLITAIVSVKGNRLGKMIPFIIGIASGYGLSLICYGIGTMFNIPEFIIINLPQFNGFLALPEFTFITGSFKDINFGYIISLFVAYAPVAFVVFAEHIADHKNLSTIIGQDLLKDPGLHRTLAGDGVGSIIGAIFGGCPNTTYGESIGCVAITKNASVITILTAAGMCIFISFISPIISILASIPTCVMGGVCIALYGFIAVSGLKMIQPIDLSENNNLFVVSAILIAGVGGLTLTFGSIQITTVACALILGIITNLCINRK